MKMLFAQLNSLRSMYLTIYEICSTLTAIYRVLTVQTFWGMVGEPTTLSFQIGVCLKLFFVIFDGESATYMPMILLTLYSISYEVFGIDTVLF